jgi:hypothetical protein
VVTGETRDHATTTTCTLSVLGIAAILASVLNIAANLASALVVATVCYSAVIVATVRDSAVIATVCYSTVVVATVCDSTVIVAPLRASIIGIATVSTVAGEYVATIPLTDAELQTNLDKTWEYRTIITYPTAVLK